MSTLEEVRAKAKVANCRQCWFYAWCKDTPTKLVRRYVRNTYGSDVELLDSIAKDCNRYCYEFEMQSIKDKALQNEDKCWFGK